MVERGARYLVFLSRSGVTRPGAVTLIQDLKAKGANPDIIKGSVTDLDLVMAAVQQLSSKRPLKGVIHAAMSEGVSVTILFFISSSRTLFNLFCLGLHVPKCSVFSVSIGSST